MIKMNYFFELCINTSVKGSILIVLILLLQKFLRRDFTAKWIYALWSLVVVRLLIPFSPIKNVVSLYNLGIIKRLQFSIKNVLLGRLGSDSNSFEIIGKTISTRFFINDVLSLDWFDIIIIIWIVGILLLLLLFSYINLKVHSIIRRSYKYTDEDLLNVMEICRKKISLRKNPTIHISPELSSPMTCGIIFPKVVIPKEALLNLNDKKMEHIFLHELVHIKRNDVFFNILGMLICIIQWFNPLIWIGYLRSKKDCELACDEKVLNTLTNDEYTEYGLTLIEMMEFASGNNLCNPIISKTLIHDRSEANARILQISRFEKKRKTVIVLSICMFCFAFFIGLTEAESTRPSNSNKQYELNDYLSVPESEIRQTFGNKPKYSYALNINENPYFILYYNVLREKVQFWFDGNIGDNSRKTLEITTTSYRGIKQGMSIEKANKMAQAQFVRLKEVQELEYLTKYIYEDIDYNILIISDKKTDKVYSLTLYKKGIL